MKQFKLLFTILFLISQNAKSENRQRAVDSLRVKLTSLNQDTQRVNTLNELSKQYIEMDIYDSAMTCASQAKTLAESLNFKKGLAISLRKLGAIQSEQSNYPKALEYYFQSLKISEEINDEYGIFVLNDAIGMVYYFQGDYNTALGYYFKADKSNFNKGLTSSNIGIAYGDMGKYDLALQYDTKSLEYYVLKKDNNGIATELNNIGTVYESKGDYKSALDYYSKSLEIKQRIQDNQGTCDALSNIGNIYFHNKKYSEAIKFYNKSLEIANKIGYLTTVKTSEETLSEIYDSIGNKVESYKHYKLFIAVKDSMFNEENTKKTVKAEMNFHYEKQQEKEKAEQDKKDAVTKIIIFSVSTGLVLVLLLAGFIFKGYRQKKKASEIIAQQKNEVEKQKKVIEEKQQEVLASIRYAKRIQMTLLPSEKYIDKSLKRLVKI